jgi:hypothetical protein
VKGVWVSETCAAKWGSGRIRDLVDNMVAHYDLPQTVTVLSLAIQKANKFALELLHSRYFGGLRGQPAMCFISGGNPPGIDRVCRGLASSRIRTRVCCTTVRSVSTKMPPIQFLLLSLICMYKTKIYRTYTHIHTHAHTLREGRRE